MSNFSPEMQAWIDEADDKPILEAFHKLRNPPTLYKFTDGMRGGPCPICNQGDEHFDLNFKKNAWFCRKGCGGGNGVKLLTLADGLSFFQAVEELTGTKPPNGWQGEVVPVDEEALRSMREDRAIKRALEKEVAERERLAKRSKAEEIFDRCLPFSGSLAERYLANRKIVLMPNQTLDLRFSPKSTYIGYAVGEKEESELGVFPAMVAAIHDWKGVLIGIHRTYLDAETGLKLQPPGNTKRNKAKKVWGEHRQGHIALGPYMEDMAGGEGIETTASWYQLGIGPDKIGIICGINLGNLCGTAAGSIPNPTKLNAKGEPTTSPNGIPTPDSENTIMRLPEIVRNFTFLIDGDSNPHFTLSNILTGARAQRNRGIECDFCHPGIKNDFNTLLMEGA